MKVYLKNSIIPLILLVLPIASDNKGKEGTIQNGSPEKKKEQGEPVSYRQEIEECIHKETCIKKNGIIYNITKDTTKEKDRVPRKMASIKQKQSKLVKDTNSTQPVLKNPSSQEEKNYTVSQKHSLQDSKLESAHTENKQATDSNTEQESNKQEQDSTKTDTKKDLALVVEPLDNGSTLDHGSTAGEKGSTKQDRANQQDREQKKVKLINETNSTLPIFKNNSSRVEKSTTNGKEYSLLRNKTETGSIENREAKDINKDHGSTKQEEDGFVKDKEPDSGFEPPYDESSLDQESTEQEQDSTKTDTQCQMHACSNWKIHKSSFWNFK